MSGAQTGYAGQAKASALASEFNALSFTIAQVLARISTATLAKVVSVTNAGGISPVGYVDVQPLVNQVNGLGSSVPHGTVHHLAYFRLQGGANAVILDPQVGDIGLVVFADRDISSVKATAAQANPGSRRRFDMADGLYIGGVLNGTPTQYVAFSASGIAIVSPTKVTIQAPNIEMDGNTLINGTLAQGTGSAGGGATFEGPVTVNQDLTAQGTSVHTHVHGGVQTGGGDTGVPV